ncbi:MAG: glycosyltransferase family 2 protein [Nitrospira sp.]|nr:glycosyltransferase family 2 protein [Nitrospira sp.]
MRKVKLLSIVVPCHNEEDVLAITHERLTKILDILLFSEKILDYELIYVDNGSTDNTLQVLKNIFDSDPHTRIIALRRNFGFQGSISAGLSYTKGDAVVTIDADLQDPPEKIEEMITYFEQGYDLVLGVREDRSSDSYLKRFFSENYYRLMKLMGVTIVYNHGDFRLMSKSLVQEFNSLPERNRLIRAMVLQLDSRYAVVPYKREQRKAGRSKFNIISLFSLSLDGIVSFTYFPLRLTSIIGILISLLTIIGAFWVLYVKLFTDKFIPGWASTLLPILALGGLQLFFLGLIGEYIGRLYNEVKKRPIFVVREEYKHESKNSDSYDVRQEV